MRSFGARIVLFGIALGIGCGSEARDEGSRNDVGATADVFAEKNDVTDFGFQDVWMNSDAEWSDLGMPDAELDWAANDTALDFSIPDADEQDTRDDMDGFDTGDMSDVGVDMPDLTNCGDGFCEDAVGESLVNCPQDC